jgi:hypothetical protein
MSTTARTPRSTDLIRPTVPPVPDGLPPAERALAARLHAAFGEVVKATTAHLGVLDRYADLNDALEAVRDDWKADRLAERRRETVQAMAEETATSRRQVAKAYAALREEITASTHVARRETLALLTPEGRADARTLELILGYARVSELPFFADRAVETGNLVDAAVLRARVAAPGFPEDIRTRVVETLEGMGKALSDYGAIVQGAAERHIAQAEAHALFVETHPTPPPAWAIMRLASSGGLPEHGLAFSGTSPKAIAEGLLEAGKPSPPAPTEADDAEDGATPLDPRAKAA